MHIFYFKTDLECFNLESHTVLSNEKLSEGYAKNDVAIIASNVRFGIPVKEQSKLYFICCLGVKLICRFYDIDCTLHN